MPQRSLPQLVSYRSARRTARRCALLLLSCVGIFGVGYAQQFPSSPASSTRLAAVPAAPISAGSAVTLTASASAASSPLTKGIVTFCDASASHCTGPAIFGTAHLTNAGTASLKLILGAGTYNISAVLAPTASAQSSTSAAQTVIVNGSSSYKSSTKLLSSGTTGNYTLNANVTHFGRGPAQATLSFLDATNGNAVIGTAALDPTTLSSGLILAPNSSFAVGDSPLSVATEDFNGDGIPDLATANFDVPGTISVLLGVGDGTFGPQVRYSVGKSPRAVAVEDFNGDGIADLAVTNNGDNTVSILLGRGDGTFVSEVPYATGNSPTSVATGDFNGDGVADLAVANYDDSNVSILLGAGNGTFAPASKYMTGADPFSVAVGDFNGDHRPDLVVACQGGGATVLLGNGDGTFQPQMTNPAGNLPAAVTIGDFNGDGQLDLAVANFDGNTLSVLLGNGDGTFQPQVIYATGTNPFFLTTGDLNADGKVDLIVVNRGGNSFSIFEGKGDGSFQPEMKYDAGNSPGSVAIADFNGDGLADVVVSNSGDSKVGVLLGAQTESAMLTQAAVTGAGTHNIFASYPGDSIRAESQSPTIALMGVAGIPTTSLSANANPINLGQSVVFTAKIATTSAVMPTGTVNFLNGTTALGSSAVDTSGVATFTANSLPSGANSITAVYSGDANFLPSTSAALTETVVAVSDFSVAATPGSQSITNGKSTTYQVSVAALNGGFGSPVNLTVTGLPSGSSASFSPATVTPGTGTATATLTVQTSSTQSASLRSSRQTPTRSLWAISLGALLMPLLGFRKLRKQLSSFSMALLLTTLSAAAMLTISGCSAPTFVNQPINQRTYTLTITGASGSLQHSTNVTLQLSDLIQAAK